MSAVVVEVAGGVILFVFAFLGTLWQRLLGRPLMRWLEDQPSTALSPRAANFNKVMQHGRRLTRWTWDHPVVIGLAAAALGMAVFTGVEVFGAVGVLACR